MATDSEGKIKFLQRVPLFATLNKRHLDILSKRLVERAYAAGDAIVTQGQGGEGMFIIAAGKAEAVRERRDGNKVELEIQK